MGRTGPNAARRIARAAIAASLLLAAPALADTRAGVDAWSRGDFAGAVRLWQVEAARGDGDAMFNLGQAYKLGKGVKQDLAMAEQLFGKAAALGHLQAADNYGLLLFQRGARAQALPYIHAAADRGDPRAEYLLGIAHFNGDLVPKDYVRAYALVSLARQGGLPQAGPALQQMDKYVSLGDRQQAVAMAQELQEQADATRARQMAAVDLGSQVPAGGGTAAPPAPPPVRIRPPAVASAEPEPAATAPGADYTPTDPSPPPPAAATLPPQPAYSDPGVDGGDGGEPAPPPRPRPHAPHPAAPRPAAAAATHPAPAGGSWRIQFGAFGVPANADALWRKLAARGDVAGHPRINAHAGSVIKLQAGGYSEAGAHAACARIAASGQTCVPVRN